MKLAINLAACILSFFLVGLAVPGSVEYSGIPAVVAAGAILWLANTLIKPVVKLLALPLTLATLGLFSLVINALMVLLADLIVPGLSVSGFGPGLLLALSVSVIQVVLKLIFHD